MSGVELDKLLQVERGLAAGGGEEYRRALSDDAVVIVPGATMDKATTVAAMEESEGWEESSLESPRLLELGGGAIGLTYLFRGTRGDFHYEAILTSVYVAGPEGVRLALHQQTPLSGT